MVPVSIPPEIWLKTAQFIPSNILQTLYSVNPVFLDIALNEKYSQISLAGQCTPTTPKYLKHLNLPHIAWRVQRLVLSSDWVTTNIYMARSRGLTFYTKIARTLPFNLGRFIDPAMRRISNIKRCNALMETAVVNFPNVSYVLIFDGSHPSSASETAPGLFLNASMFTSLEEISLKISPRDGSNVDVEAASTFFQAVASTLTSLDISYHNTFDEPSRLLQMLSRQAGQIAFPKLTSFSLFHMEPLALPDSNIMRFLNQHADTLKRLRLQHTKRSTSQSPDNLSLLPLPVLPHVETLNILSGSSWKEGLDAALGYIHHSWITLTTLV
ncbi:hypothetical protein M413DRAFT_30682 [Hebeloma cylindrosporum]|uniref:F-box domain-containing protein n=1 Tax=Hebeloma cylindrosporum TaxID=76867 RepID=A0A0C3C2B5_HEBCY|nr:hypothetical protein M413DRAFT_30682 [Hebeloma cylindrosporum h7]